MKRLLSLLVTAFVVLTASAQISDGFYRLQCKQTGRYLTIHNDYVNKESAKRTGNVELQSLETISGFENIVNDPGSIIYMKSTSKGWAIEAQGFTTEGRLDIQITQVDDAYRLWTTVTSDGMTITRYLRDYEEEPGYSYITSDADKSSNWEWYIIPVDDSEYLGLYGDVQVGNSYYTTFYAAFPIQLGAGMKAYAVNSLQTNSCTLQDIGNIVPAKTAVVIACAGEDASANKVTPLRSTDVKVEANRLSGAIFCYPVLLESGKERRSNPAWNTVDYDPETMRVLGEADGKLCFVTSDILSYVPANSTYLNVQEGSAETLPTDGTTGISSISRDPSNSSNSRDTRGTYTLNGTRLPDNATPQKGIYIENGKKVIKK